MSRQPAKRSGKKPKGQTATFWALTAVASSLFSSAGVSQYTHGSYTLWLVCLSGILYAFAFYNHESNSLPALQKKIITVGVALLFVVAAVLLPSSRHRPANSEPSTGTASTTGDQSPAVTGSGNTISYGGNASAAKPDASKSKKGRARP